MKINRSFIKDKDNNIDFLELLIKIWKEKVFLITASLLFMIVGYVYGLLQPKIYKITILLREAPAYLFELQPIQIKNFSFNERALSLAKEFNNEFKVILSSSENLDRFLKQNNKNLKAKIEIKIDQEKNNSFQYTLTYEEYLAADQFLNDFIDFAKQEAETFFKKQTAHMIANEIKKYKENLEIAKKINLEKPNPSFYNSKDFMLDDAIFNRGEKVLTYQIEILNKMLNDSTTLKLDYNPILEKVSPTRISISSLKFAVVALLLGLSLSIVIILIKSSLLIRD